MYYLLHHGGHVFNNRRHQVVPNDDKLFVYISIMFETATKIYSYCVKRFCL